MTPSSLPNDIRSLSVADRIELATAIWDSVAADSKSVPFTGAQKDEIDRRLAARQKEPDAGVSWEDLKQRLLERS